jgi:uncharacterized protein (TIRG00374 family)
MSADAHSSNLAEPAPLPSGLSLHGLGKAALRLGALIAIVVVVVSLLPGLGQLREQFAHAQAVWIVVGCAFELLSVLSYVPAFRVAFCTRMSWAATYKISVAEEGAGALFPVGGAGGLALGVWALRRAGMPSGEVARKTVAFFLLTSVPNVASLGLLGLGLAIGVLPGNVNVALAVIPAVVGAGAIAATLALRRLIRGLETWLRRHPDHRRLARIMPALGATADGVDEAVRQLRRSNPMLLVGLIGYMLFDILVLWASFRAIGAKPELTIVWIAYLIGQLGNWIPIPGGIGGTELGLVGALVLYGLPALTATAAVLIYRVIELWIPAALGIVAFLQLRVLLRREADAIDVCQPGETIEVIGLGSVVPKPVASES